MHFIVSNGWEKEDLIEKKKQKGKDLGTQKFLVLKYFTAVRFIFSENMKKKQSLRLKEEICWINHGIWTRQKEL